MSMKILILQWPNIWKVLRRSRLKLYMLMEKVALAEEGLKQMKRRLRKKNNLTMKKGLGKLVANFGNPAEGLKKLISEGISAEELRDKARKIEAFMKELQEEKIRIISLAAAGFDKDPMEREFDVKVEMEAVKSEAIAMKHLKEAVPTQVAVNTSVIGGGGGSKTKKEPITLPKFSGEEELTTFPEISDLIKILAITHCGLRGKIVSKYAYVTFGQLSTKAHHQS